MFGLLAGAVGRIGAGVAARGGASAVAKEGASVVGRRQAFAAGHSVGQMANRPQAPAPAENPTTSIPLKV